MSLSLPLPTPSLLPYQDDLRPFVPTVLGNLEYNRFRLQLESIDHLPLHLGIEKRFLETALAHELGKRQAEAKVSGKLRKLCPGDQTAFQKNTAIALRCSVLRTLTGQSYRVFAKPSPIARCASGSAVSVKSVPLAFRAKAASKTIRNWSRPTPFAKW